MPAVENPVAQGVHAAPAVVEYWPIGQGRQAVPEAYCPAPHAVQELASVLPATRLDNPGPQGVHEDTPVDEDQVPMAHGVHTVPLRNAPAGHSVQPDCVVVPVAAVEAPAWHVRHVDMPALGAYWATGQS